MKLIPLTQGKSVQVDDWNYDLLSVWEWYAKKGRSTYYAVRHKNGEHSKLIRMHRVIMNTPDDMLCDHQDHNGLNCLEENMRNCTRQQNGMNRTAHGVSEYLGVSIRQKGRCKGLISAQIRIDNKLIHLGNFKSEVLAAQAYDKAALKYFGEFANLNFPEKIEEYKLLILKDNEKG